VDKRAAKDAAKSPATAWTSIFARVDFQKDVAAPVVEKLMVTSIIFLVLATGKGWIYPLLWPQPSAKDFPIYATGEAFTNPSSRLVEGEIYVVNLTDRALSEDAQRQWLVEQNEWNPLKPDTQIYVRWLRGGMGMTLREDKAFNEGKGSLEVIEPTGSERTWRIRVKDINRQAILRIKMTTDYEAPLTRNDKISLPFQIQGPRPTAP
jgi:hypothetical protein